MWLDGKWEMNFLGKEPGTEWVLKTRRFAVQCKVYSHFTQRESQGKTVSAVASVQ